jgi:hypothetical protein
MASEEWRRPDLRKWKITSQEGLNSNRKDDEEYVTGQVKTLSEDGEDLISEKKRRASDVRVDHIRGQRSTAQYEWWTWYWSTLKIACKEQWRIFLRIFKDLMQVNMKSINTEICTAYVSNCENNTQGNLKTASEESWNLWLKKVKVIQGSEELGTPYVRK